MPNFLINNTLNQTVKFEITRPICIIIKEHEESEDGRRVIFSKEDTMER